MPFNLVTEPWLPVRRASGAREWIPPWAITERVDEDPVIAIDFPRADMSSGALEWCIGLLNTAFAPRHCEDEEDWWTWLDAPPSPEQLREAFATEVDAFELFDDDGPAFMQDLDPAALTGESPIGALFMDTPGDNTLKENKDLFIKRGRIERLCPACTAAALTTLQTYAPSGGQGNRTGLRGGGPLTTLPLGRTLWETLWFAVWPPADLYPKLGGDIARPRAGGVYPWLAPTRTSEKTTGREAFPQDVHPLHVFWATPRRIRLIHDTGSAAPCDICERETEDHVIRFRAKNLGANYAGAWRHPLSAYRDDPNAGPISIKGAADMGAWKDWLGLLFRTNDNRQYPALVVSTFVARYEMAPEYFALPRLHIFGFDMDNMKARAWIDATMPLIVAVDEETREQERALVEKLVACGEEVRKALYSAVKKGLVSPWSKVPASNATMEGCIRAFWILTEVDFFQAVRRALEAFPEPDADVRTDAIKRTFLQALSRRAAQLFDERVPYPDGEARAMELYVQAVQNLRNNITGARAKTWGLLDITKKAPSEPVAPSPGIPDQPQGEMA